MRFDASLRTQRVNLNLIVNGKNGRSTETVDRKGLKITIGSSRETDSFNYHSGS